jgi:hypothetical protein
MLPMTDSLHGLQRSEARVPRAGLKGLGRQAELITDRDPNPRWRADRGHNGWRAGSAMDSPLPGCPMPTPRLSGDEATLGAALAGATGATGAGCAPTRPTAMVVIDGRPPPGLMLEPYITSVPGAQPTSNSTVMQTLTLVIARSPSGGLHGFSLGR